MFKLGPTGVGLNHLPRIVMARNTFNWRYKTELGRLFLQTFCKTWL